VSFKERDIATSGTLDRVGMAASLICAVHCAITPLIFTLLPLFGLTFLKDEKFDWTFIALSVVIGVTSLIPSYLRKHRMLLPIILFGFGVILLIAARHLESLGAELPVVLVGALLVVTARRVNRRLCRSCAKCQDEHIKI